MKYWQVSKAESGLKLIAFLSAKLNKGYSARKLKGWIEKSLCTVNNAIERFASYRLKAGDKIGFNLQAAESQVVRSRFSFEAPRVLYEDDHLLIYNKPAGIVSDGKGLAALFPRYFPVHRLDKETSGAIVFAKQKAVKDSLIEAFKKFEVKKEYAAFLDGSLKTGSGTIENYLGKISKDGEEPLWGIVSQDIGRFAKTTWKVERQGANAAFVRCYPETGRTHQLRVHFKELGHPILGDYRYARKYRCPLRPARCLLHAAKISFTHPLTGASIQTEAPLPEDFAEAMEALFP